MQKKEGNLVKTSAKPPINGDSVQFLFTASFSSAKRQAFTSNLPYISSILGRFAEVFNWYKVLTSLAVVAGIVNSF